MVGKTVAVPLYVFRLSVADPSEDIDVSNRRQSFLTYLWENSYLSQRQQVADIVLKEC